MLFNNVKVLSDYLINCRISDSTALFIIVVIVIVALVYTLDGCFNIKSLGRSVRFADLPAETLHKGKRKKKRIVKRTKAITPLQAMMLRMAGTLSCHTVSLP